MGVSIREETRGLWGSSSSPGPSSLNAAQLPFRTPPLQPIHPRKQKKKKVGIYQNTCFVLFCATQKTLHYVRSKPPFSERNNNLELSFLECIINVISSCLCPSVCVEWWVWAPSANGLGARAAGLWWEHRSYMKLWRVQDGFRSVEGKLCLLGLEQRERVDHA